MCITNVTIKSYSRLSIVFRYLRNGKIFSRARFEINQFLERSSSHRIEYLKKSYSFGLFNTSKGFYFRVYGCIEREDGYQTFQDIPKLKTEAILGKSFLVERLFCKYIRIRSSYDKEICQISRTS